MRAYSMDLRERVFADCQAGMATPAVAHKYTVSASWVRRLKQRQTATGSLAPRPHRPGRPVALAPHEARVRELVREDPDATLGELRQRLGVTVSLSALAEYLRRLKRSFKKSHPGGRAGPPRREAEAGRLGRPDARAGPGQAGVPRRDQREHPDDPAVRPRPAGPAAGVPGPARAREDDHLRGGPAGGRAGRPDGDRRAAHRRPLRRLRRAGAGPGTAARGHGGAGQPGLSQAGRGGAVRAIEGAGGAVVYLPPDSPDFNPIKQAFAKAKARLRAAERRTIGAVEGFFGTVHEAFPPRECGNYIRHAGYNATALPQAL